jgi:hypothetical protein
MIVIVQPWFAAIGHPAQSLLNTAKTLGKSDEIKYLISSLSNDKVFSTVATNLKNYGDVVDFPVKTDSLLEGTFKAVLRLKTLINKNASIDRVLFFDAHILLLSCMWRIFFSQKNHVRFGVVYLHGPEHIKSRVLAYQLIKRFVSNSKVTLFLRTDELVHAWKLHCPDASVMRLPTMEIPVDEVVVSDDQQRSSELCFGILGQIREGKGLAWIVPAFKNNQALGKLTVAGEFASEAQKVKLDFLNGFSGFINKYLSEQELLDLAAKQDYLLMLYDEWDARLEGAVMYLAARVNKPVIVYNEGWCGRMVETYKNGISISKINNNFLDIIYALPKPDTKDYETLLEGVKAFRRAHSGESVSNEFLQAIKF